VQPFRSNSDDPLEERAPTEASLFALALYGKPMPAIIRPEVRARARREELERLARFSSHHADELRRLEKAEHEARHERELLEFAAKISDRAAAKLNAILRNEAEEREAWRRAEEFVARLHASQEAERREQRTRHSLTEAWNEADHPRQPAGTRQGGEWASKGEGNAAGGDTQERRPPEHGHAREPSPEMLDLAHTWFLKINALRQARDDIAKLPKQIASTQARLGSGGHYAYLVPKHLAELRARLDDVRSSAPELEKQLADLEQQYHDSGFDDVPYSTWTRGETIVGGKGIADVGYAVANKGEPAGLERTGDEVTVALAAPAVLGIGRALLSRVASSATRRLGANIERLAIRNHAAGSQPIRASLQRAAAPEGEADAIMTSTPSGAGRYSHLPDSKSIGPGKKFTASQKTAIYRENMARNGGRIKSDLDGEELIMPTKSASGVSPPRNEAQIDHVVPSKPANADVSPGSNSHSNAQVLSRQQNRSKSNN
jgi:hypothetical protein